MIIFYKLLSFTQCSPLIDPIDVQEIGSKNNWTTPLVSYLKNDALLDGRGTTSKLKVQATWFVLIKDILYKREVHEGICENHSRSQLLVHKLIRDGYYWPTMQKDAQTYVKAYDSKPMTNAKGSVTSSNNRRKNSSQWQSHGHSLNGDWISWVRSR